MFQFTTTHVINSNQYNDQGVALWSNDNPEIFSVKGVNDFKKENVLDVYEQLYTEAVPEVMTIDLSSIKDLKAGDTLRLSMYIRLTSADDCSYYANDTQYKGRPFTIEFPFKGDNTAKNLEKLITKWGLMVFEKPVVKVECVGNVITLTAINEFQRFHSAKLEKFVESTNPFADNWELIEALDREITGGVFEITTSGVEGFGDYGWILRNIKLPTFENTRAFAPKAGEMPIPGAHYDQYTIRYCVERGPLGMNAVGQSVKSVTTHVFYVNKDVAAGFGEALKKFAKKDSEQPGNGEVEE